MEILDRPDHTPYWNVCMYLNLYIHLITEASNFFLYFLFRIDTSYTKDGFWPQKMLGHLTISIIMSYQANNTQMVFRQNPGSDMTTPLPLGCQIKNSLDICAYVC